MSGEGDGLTFVQRQFMGTPDEDEESDKNSNNGSKWSRFIRSPRTRWTLFLILFALTVPVLLFYFLIHRPQTDARQIEHTCSIHADYRIMCGDGNFTEIGCLEISCCYDFADEYCYHYLPSKYNYMPSNGGNFVPNLPKDVFGNDMNATAKITVQHLDEFKVKIILHNSLNYEDIELPQTSYRVVTYQEDLGLDIFRDDGHLLLTTGLGPLMVSEDYLEWSFDMGRHLFGLDQLYFTNNETYKKVIYKNREDHTTIPAFMAYVNGSYHGLVFDISGPMEFSVLPSKLVSVRVLSGDEISFVLVTGPTPMHVHQQLYQFKLPPRWVLEPHICRNGSTDLQSVIDEYTAFREANTEIKYATDCLDSNIYYLLHSMNETERELLSETIDLVNENSRFVMTVYPQIVSHNESSIYNVADELDLLYMDGLGFQLEGYHLNQQVAYLDYNAADTDALDAWFVELLNLFASFDVAGYSLKDNWPDEEYFLMERVTEIPYLNKTFLGPMSFTIAWNATTPTFQRHFRIHNKYGKGQVDTFQRQFGEDAFILTSSYTSDVGDAIAQVQNMNTSWVNLKKAIQTTLLHGLFASPFISIPVCGSTSEYLPDVQNILCSRWYITAATMPIFTVSSDLPRRDHTALPSGHNRNIAVDALNKRKMLLPYYYTTLSRNELITRPMFYDFPRDEYTHVLDEQYMLGDALLVAQPLLRDTYLMVVYLPPEAGGFYEFLGGQYHGGELGNISLSVVVESDWIVFMREGKIVPMQNDNSSYTLAISLSKSNQQMAAIGSLYFNNQTLELSANDTALVLGNLDAVREDLHCIEGGVELPTVISEAKIYGLVEDVYLISTFGIDLCETTADVYEVEYSLEVS